MSDQPLPPLTRSQLRSESAISDSEILSRLDANKETVPVQPLELINELVRRDQYRLAKKLEKLTTVLVWLTAALFVLTAVLVLKEFHLI